LTLFLGSLKIDLLFRFIHFGVCSLVGGCGSDGLVNDSYVENDNGNDEDVDDADDDTTLVKQSESVVAAASGTEHLESKIADLQWYEIFIHHVVVKRK